MLGVSATTVPIGLFALSTILGKRMKGEAHVGAAAPRTMTVATNTLAVAQ
jgi:hypothetical protein